MLCMHKIMYVVLNVGGKLFATDTLTLRAAGRESILHEIATTAEGKNGKVDMCMKDEAGYFFLDGDASSFRIILQFLRSKVLESTMNSLLLTECSMHELGCLLEESSHFSLNDLHDMVDDAMDEKRRQQRVLSFEKLITLLNMSSKRVNLCGVYFANQDLTGLTFVNCQLRYAGFDGANLTNCRFLSCDITGSSFRSARVRSTLFDSCSVVGTDFSRADLTNATWRLGKMEAAKIEDAFCDENADTPVGIFFEDCSLIRLDFRTCHSSASNALRFLRYGKTFSSKEKDDLMLSAGSSKAACLLMVTMECVTFVAVAFASVEIVDCSLNNCRFINVSFDRSCIRGTDMSYSHFVDCSFNSCSGQQFRALECTFTHTPSKKYVDFSFANFSSSDFRGSSFYRLHCPNASFQSSDVRGTSFTKTYSDTGCDFKDIRRGIYITRDGEERTTLLDV